MWIALRRQGEEVGRGRVQRLMREAGVQGAKRRDKPWRTTKADPRAARRPDLVERDFTAPTPKRLEVGDFTYLRSWEGMSYFAFVIDSFSRKVDGRRLASHMRTALVLDALRMALGRRNHGADLELVLHTDRGSQGGFNRSSQHLIEEGCDGKAEGLGIKADGAAGGTFAGSTGGRTARTPAAVLGGDRAGTLKRSGRRRGRRVALGLATGGFERVAGCRISASRSPRGATSHSPSAT
jgi:hypothetical protein